jgi:hypothetical protein
MGWRSTTSRAAGTSDAERKARGRSSAGGGRERGENLTPPPSMLDKAAPAWAATATSGDRHLRTLRHEHGHRTVTRLVVSGVFTVTGARG